MDYTQLIEQLLGGEVTHLERKAAAALEARTYMDGYSEGKAWALEEAAKVAEDSDHIVDVGGYHAQLGDASATQRNIVAAIRALKGGA